MATQSLTQLVENLNNHIDLHVELETKLRQMDAQARVGENVNLEEFPKETPRYYWVTLMDLTEAAIQLSENLSQKLIELASALREHAHTE